MPRCKVCGVPVTPGCAGERGSDGFLSMETDESGAVHAVALHWSRQCSGIEVGRLRPFRHHVKPLLPMNVVPFPVPNMELPATIGIA